MALNREELAADLVWRYVEHVRETPDAETLSPGEIEQLIEIMLSVAPTGDAVALETTEARRAAVRARVQQVLAGPRPALAARPVSPEPRPAILVPAWRFRAVCGAAAALALAVGTVGFWHHPPVRVVRMAFPRGVRNVEAMDEVTAHRMIPHMVRNELRPTDERNLMGHMLVCPGCFNDYISLKQRTVQARTTLAAYAREGWE